MRCRLSLKADGATQAGRLSKGLRGAAAVHAVADWLGSRPDVVATAHRLPLPVFCVIQLWNVCSGGCGTSRCVPRRLSPL